VAIIPLGPGSRLDSSSLPEGPNELGELSPPIWPCTTRGLPCPRCCHRGGGLLPHRFTLTECSHLPQSACAGCLRALWRFSFRRPPRRIAPAVYFLWHFP